MTTHTHNRFPSDIAGVKNLVAACQAAGVRVLVHTSSVAVVMGGVRLLEHTEPLSPEVTDSQLVLGEYAVDRRRAEEVVLSAHGSTAHNGEGNDLQVDP